MIGCGHPPLSAQAPIKLGPNHANSFNVVCAVAAFPRLDSPKPTRQESRDQPVVFSTRTPAAFLNPAMRRLACALLWRSPWITTGKPPNHFRCAWPLTRGGHNPTRAEGAPFDGASGTSAQINQKSLLTSRALRGLYSLSLLHFRPCALIVFQAAVLVDSAPWPFFFFWRSLSYTRSRYVYFVPPCHCQGQPDHVEVMFGLPPTGQSTRDIASLRPL